MAEPLLIGVDIGSTNIKAVLFDRRGGIRGEAYRTTPLKRDGEQTIFPVDGLTGAALDVVAEIAAGTPADSYIAGLAFASIGESFVLYDDAGEPLADIIAWYDRRAAGEAAEIVETIGAETLFRITGLSIDPTLTACKLLWLRRNAGGLLDRATGIAFIADWLAFRVSGVCATDVSLATRSLLASPAAGRWSAEMMDALGFPAPLFPTIMPTGSPLGPPMPEACRRLGLTERCMVSVGGHDHILGSVAAGAATPSLMIDSAGTAEAIVRTGPRLVERWPAGRLEFAQGGSWWAKRPRPLIYLVGSMFDSGGAMSRLRTATAGDADWDRMIAEARNAAPGAARYHGERGVGLESDPAAWTSAVFSGSRAPGARFRALLERLALQSRLLCDRLTDLAGLPPVSEFRLVGGLARNALYAELKAAAFEMPIRVAEFPEFTALGAAIAAGLGAGVYPSLDAAQDEIQLQWKQNVPDPALVAAAHSLRACLPET